VALVDVRDCDRDILAGTWSAEPLASPKPLQEFRGQITFKRKFTLASITIVWLTGFDFMKGKNCSIKTDAANFTATRFNIEVVTLVDSFSASSRGLYKTIELRLWHKPQLSQAR
jgi:hypothetical protein